VTAASPSPQPVATPTDAGARLAALECHLLATGEDPAKLCPVAHHFCAGLYAREVTLPAGYVVIGHPHRAPCLNIVTAGRALVHAAGTVVEIKAGDIFATAAGVRKAALVFETLRFVNVHPNADDLRDAAALEVRHVEPSETFIRHHEIAALRAAERPV
jgi:hypothetical protein